MDRNVTEAAVGLTADIVSAYVTNNSIAAADLPGLIQSVHRSLTTVGAPAVETPALTPAVPIRKSVHPDYLVSLEDGRRYKSLKRHLTTRGMSPDEYRAKWGLPKDYPMVAANYSAQRSSLAKTLGLGRKPAPVPAIEAPKTAKTSTTKNAGAKRSTPKAKPAAEAVSEANEATPAA